ncbi:YeeE/YedE family protein [Thalassobaculum salexigens]|uniref:YeeE/YedE family protein n=1 Tax=Thalassobaculum salexigens TaxID=455360 RepID=UPI000400B8DD|nr:YeeE/YedE thiosulfate transporter family protein [Thalassobaculum salexigens]
MMFDLSDALNGLLGGLMIGLAAALFLLANGRIAGISGIAVSMATAAVTRRRLESAAFVAGLILAPLAYAALAGPVEIGVTPSVPLLLAAGLLVGIGTRIGNGCTSGHGVCGLSRLSRRSMVATATFMAVAVLVAGLAPLVIGG